MGDLDRFRGLLGVVVILGAAWLFSEDRRRISARMVLGGLAMQGAFGLVLVRSAAGRAALEAAARWVDTVLACSDAGARIVFGERLVDPAGPAGFVFAFRVLPTIVFVAPLFAVLYHLGIMQQVVRACAWVTARILGSSGAETLNAAARGTREGLLLAANVRAVLISFIALVALVNLALGGVGGRTGWPELSLQRLLAVVFAPCAWLIGVPAQDCRAVGGLLGTRTVLNELIAYFDMGRMRATLTPKAYTLATIAMCSFANISSIGIQLGGIGALVPERRGELARLAAKMLVISTLASALSAATAGVLMG